jgi:hypothetical protein
MRPLGRETVCTHPTGNELKHYSLTTLTMFVSAVERFVNENVIVLGPSLINSVGH